MNPEDSVLFSRQTPRAALRGCPGQPTARNVQFGGGDAGGEQPLPTAAPGSAEETVIWRPHKHLVHFGNHSSRHLLWVQLISSETITEWFPLIVLNCPFQGTTGFPKAATLSHFNIVNNSNLFGRRTEYDWRVSSVLVLFLLFNFTFI